MHGTKDVGIPLLLGRFWSYSKLELQKYLAWNNVLTATATFPKPSSAFLLREPENDGR